MPDAVIIKLLKGNALRESPLTRGAKKFPCWDKLVELVHCGTDSLFLARIHLNQTTFKFLRPRSVSLVQQRLSHRIQFLLFLFVHIGEG